MEEETSRIGISTILQDDAVPFQCYHRKFVSIFGNSISQFISYHSEKPNPWNRRSILIHGCRLTVDVIGGAAFGTALEKPEKLYYNKVVYRQGIIFIGRLLWRSDLGCVI